jgi:NADH:ubiquinone oxidoreductase subunit K
VEQFIMLAVAGLEDTNMLQVRQLDLRVVLVAVVLVVKQQQVHQVTQIVLELLVLLILAAEAVVELHLLAHLRQVGQD